MATSPAKQPSGGSVMMFGTTNWDTLTGLHVQSVEVNSTPDVHIKTKNGVGATVAVTQAGFDESVTVEAAVLDSATLSNYAAGSVLVSGGTTSYLIRDSVITHSNEDVTMLRLTLETYESVTLA